MAETTSMQDGNMRVINPLSSIQQPEYLKYIFVQIR